MSSLMVASDLEMMMLEFAVQKLFVPKTSIFDSVIMKKTTVMFRMLDYDWIELNPQRTDYAPYRGSNLEVEDFHGGKSVVFAIPGASLENKMNDVDIQIHVRKEVSKYFEMDSCQNVGIVLVNVDALFNGIIKELRERKELEEHLSAFHERQPISRSLKGTYEIIDEDERITGATIAIYVRLSHFGKSIITEIERGRGKRGDFYAQEETNESYPYQCKELTISKLRGGSWGSETCLPPIKPDRLTCHCDTWGAMVDRTNEKSDDSDDDTQQRRSHSFRRSSAAEHHKVRGSRDDGDGRGNGKKGGKGKKIVKGDGVRDKVKRIPTAVLKRTDYRGSVEKTKVSAGKRGKKVSDDEKVKERVSQIEDVSKVRRNTASGSTKKGGRASQQVAEKMEKAPRGRPIGSGRSFDRTAKTEKRVERGRSQEAKKTERTDDLKDQKLIEKSNDKTLLRTTDGTKSTTDGRKSTTDGTKSTTEANRRMQLLRRHCGVITVGLRDKEKKICPEALEKSPTTLPPVLQISTSIQPTICSTLHSLPHCCYPSISACTPAMFLPLNCSTYTRNDRLYHLSGGSAATNIPEMAILTN